ncbi:hypothetical protein Tco_0742237, partial [Tanacetum coccineum]
MSFNGCCWPQKEPMSITIKTLEIQIIANEQGPYKKEDLERLPLKPETNPRNHRNEGSYGPQFLKAYSDASHIDSSIPRKEKDPGRASVSVMPLSTYLNLGLGELAHTKLTVELADRIVKYPKGIAENMLVGIGKFVFPVDFIILDMPEDIKVPLILGRPFLSIARAKIDLDLETRLMGETLVINISLDPLNGDYIKLNDLNEPFKLRRDEGDDLMPTIDESKVVYKGNNVVGALMNVPIFVGTFSVMTDFAVLKDMDAYRDNEMSDVIFGEPFLREVGIKTKRFEGIITLYNGDNE